MAMSVHHAAALGTRRCRLESQPTHQHAVLLQLQCVCLITLNCIQYSPLLDCCCWRVACPAAVALLPQRLKEQRERRSESLAKKRAMRMASVASKE
jgi:hypothetical protein